jgi:ribonucleoside-diphosphate reductase alpha chain
MPAYKRRRKVNPNDQNARVDFVDEVGDSWEEYHVFHHHFATWLQLNGFNLEEVQAMDEEQLDEVIAKSPYYGATANDVDWVQKVKLQGSVQQWVDHSISVTVNVPNEVSEEMVGQIYQAGWESGCKGITVYRDGSRSGVLISNSEGKKQEGSINEFLETKPPKRPDVLEAKVVRFNNNSEKWIAVVGILNDRPYEIFTGKAEDSFYMPNYVKAGYVIKNKDNGNARYDFRYLDKDGYEITIGGLSRAFDSEFWNYAKLISGVLRHGMPLPYVVDMVSDLHLNDETLNTWKNGVVRALKQFIADGTSPTDNLCPECGDAALIYEEGCLNCKSCGHSKCG